MSEPMTEIEHSYDRFNESVRQLRKRFIALRATHDQRLSQDQAQQLQDSLRDL